MNRLAQLPSPDQAAGCITCLGCLAWPRVQHHRASRHGFYPEYWSVDCRCSNHVCTGDTRESAVAEWNERNARG